MEYPLTLSMLGIMAVDELRTAARHRRIDTGVPVFLGLVRTEAFWLAKRESAIRRASTSFRLGDMVDLFDKPMDHPLLARFETHLSSALWMLAHDLHIVDGTSFVDLSACASTIVFSGVDDDVALLMSIDRERGQFRLTAAVV